MKRGDVVTVALQGDLGKLRPAVIVQSDHFNPTHASVTVPLTADLVPAPTFRVTVEPSAANGLTKLSQVMVDKVISVRRERIGRSVGRLDEPTMTRLNRSMAVWLGIA